MRLGWPWLLAAAILLLGWGLARIDGGARLPGSVPPGHAQPSPQAQVTGDQRTAARAKLPPEARRTIALIRQGGRFPHRQDGGVFGNREGQLPRMPRGWYREYTVETPGLGHRGARRIVTGGDPPRDWYYTDDHYGSFSRFLPDAAMETR